MQAGSGILLLNQANTFSGSTTISSGTLQLANLNALQNSTVTVNLPTNGLTFSTSPTTFDLGGLTGNGNLAMSNTAGSGITLQVGGNNTSTQFSGNLSGGSLTKAGNGTLTLSGSNTYGGVTTVSGGVLEATTTASLANFSSGTISVGSGAALAVQVLAGSAANGWSDANIATLEGNSNLTFAGSRRWASTSWEAAPTPAPPTSPSARAPSASPSSVPAG